MQKDINKFKVLLIVSKEINKYLAKEFDLSNKNGSIAFADYIIEYIVDPTRWELEAKITDNDYLCIIPCTDLCIEKNEAKVFHVFSYNVCEVLEKNNINYFGNKYITNLILNETVSCLKLSEFELPTEICTKYSFSHGDKFRTIFNNSYCTIEPLYHKDLISFEKYPVNPNDNINEKLSEVFHLHPNVDELIIYKHFSQYNEIVISIIGNPPYSNTLIYTTKDLLEDSANTDNLLIESYRLFEIYSLKDFAQFKYIYNQDENKFYLSEINGKNCINKYLLDSAKKTYNLDLEKVLCLIILSHLSSQTFSPVLKPYILRLINSLPEELTNNILPLHLKKLLNMSIDYRHVCTEINYNFLKPDESNKYKILTQIKQALHQLPKLTHIESPFLGTKNDYEFLNNYCNIPSEPQNSQDILDASIKILTGQMRWHSPTMLNNIDPPIMFSTIAASAITNLYNPCTMERSSSSGYLKMENQIVQQLSDLIGWNIYDSAGVFTTGGKSCIMYAIKSGLNRCKEKTKYGHSPIVITSDINHYSIETVCYQLGMEKFDCIRIPSTPEGIMDFSALEKTLYEKLSNGIPIACIIFSGGNTTDCFVEDIYKGVNIIQKVVEKSGANYCPYIYYDLVVCWPWLFFNKYDFKNNNLKIPKNILKKINMVANMIKHAYLADGIGIDFHKLGFSPLQNSLFLSKKSIELFSLMQSNTDPNFREPYHYTFSNSRGGTHIISAWNVLQCVGIKGFQSYIANMLIVTDVIGNELENNNFEIVHKNKSFGFATILWTTYQPSQMTFDVFVSENEDIILKNNKYLYQFVEYLKEEHNPGYFLRFLPNHITSSSGTKIATISIFPTTLNLNEEKAKKVAKDIASLKRQFDKHYLTLFSNINNKIPDEVPK